MTDALVIGAGPAGLMAAEEMAKAGRKVVVADAKPSIGRKFLMAGKSGLNLTKAEPLDTFESKYESSAEHLRPMLGDFGPEDVQDWARGLGQEIFTGSSGRVFPKKMKASPLLRAWVNRLSDLGVEFRTRWRWVGWDSSGMLFETPNGETSVIPKVTVLALGGASWAKLGSDGAWANILAGKGVDVAPFEPANAGLKVRWSDHMSRHFGAPIKGISLRAGGSLVRGECLVSRRGLEGGGIYSVSKPVRTGENLTIDLLPDWSEQRVLDRLSQPREKATVANHIRKTLKLDPVKLALLMEFGRPLPDGADLAKLVKNLPVKHDGLRPIDEAISTAGGVTWGAVDKSLMLKACPGVFVCGEMLDWEAPTGGYLITGCLATGRWAGRNAAQWSQVDPL